MNAIKHPRADQLADLACLVITLGKDNEDWRRTAAAIINRELRMLEVETARSLEPEV